MCVLKVIRALATAARSRRIGGPCRETGIVAGTCERHAQQKDTLTSRAGAGVDVVKKSRIIDRDQFWGGSFSEGSRGAPLVTFTSNRHQGHAELDIASLTLSRAT